MNVNFSKLVVAVCAMIAASVLAITKSIDGGTSASIITLILGYMLGNGVATIQGKSSEPIVAPTSENTK